MNITKDTRKELLKTNSDKVFATVMTIEFEHEVINVVNDSKDLIIGEVTYEALDFKVSIPANIENSTGNINLIDVDSSFTRCLQETNNEVVITLAVVRVDDLTNFVDGPYYFKLTNFTNSNGKIKMGIKRKSRTDYTASKYSYDANNFPGLFG